MTYSAIFPSTPEKMQELMALCDGVRDSIKAAADPEARNWELRAEMVRIFDLYIRDPDDEDFTELFSAERTFSTGVTLVYKILVFDGWLPFEKYALSLNGADLISSLGMLHEREDYVHPGDMMMINGDTRAYSGEKYTFAVINARHKYDETWNGLVAV